MAQAGTGAALVFPSTGAARQTAAVAIAVHGGVLATWVMTRTTGPPIGADASLAEPVAFADLVTVALQGLAAGAAVVMLVSGRRVVRRLMATPALGAILVGVIPVVAVADPDAHGALCQAHADAGYDVGPLAAVYGHSALEPGGPPLTPAVGQRITVLTGKLINCDNHPVTVIGAQPLNSTGGIIVENFLVGRLDSSGSLQDLGHHGIQVDPTEDEATLGLFAVIRAGQPGPFGIHAIAVQVGDHHGDPVVQPFPTVILGHSEEP